MDGILKKLGSPMTERGGFVLPVVIFGLLIMGVVVVAAFHTAGDEQLSARAVRESSAAWPAPSTIGGGRNVKKESRRSHDYFRMSNGCAT